MEVNKFSVDIPCLPEVPFMLEAHFFKAPSRRAISPLNHGIDSRQVIDGECQGGETCPCRCSHSFVPIVRVANDNAYFAALVGRINMFERAVPDECFISIHSEQPILSFGEVLY